MTRDDQKNEPQARRQGTGLRDRGREGNRKGLIRWEGVRNLGWTMVRFWMVGLLGTDAEGE